MTESSEISSDNVLILAEQLHILLIDRQNGGLIRVNDRNLRYAFAGAILMDLAREYRIDTDLKSLHVVDTTPLGDDILDESLTLMTQSDTKEDVIYWIERLASPELIHRIRRRVVDRLIGRQIFDQDAGGIIYLNKQVTLTGRYPGISLPESQDIVLRIMNVIFSDDIPSPLETMLIALADACLVFKQILTKEELSERSERIKLVSGLDLIGLSIRKAILTVRKPEDEEEKLRKLFVDTTAKYIHTRLPPMVPGALPLIGHSLRLRPVPTKALAEYYQRFGPVFRIRDLSSEMTVMAGPEANLFCQKHGRSLFRSNNTYTPLFEGMDAQRIVLSMDAEEHFKLRKALSPGFHRDHYLSKIPEIQDIILREIPESGVAVATKLFGQLTAKSIGLACTGYELTSSQAENMDFFLRRLIAATVVRALPRAMMHTKRVRRAKAIFFDTFASMLGKRLEGEIEIKNPDVVDAMLELYQSSPDFLPEQELRVSCLGPIFSGLHTTASTAAFAMYLLLKHPNVMEQVQLEADFFFGEGGRDPSALKSMDITRRAILETLRLYNPFGSVFRDSINTFDFGGYTVPTGTKMFIPTSVPHFLSEFFPEPNRFDIDRYLPNRNEHHQSGVYMPYGFGTHRCLGSSIADNHLLFSLATILHHRNVEMVPSDYKMKIIFDGVPAPTRKFKLKLSPRQVN